MLACMAVSTAQALPSQVSLSGIRHEYQRFNNCGPATMGMYLSYYGRSENQYDLAKTLKPNSQDKNVSPLEIAQLAENLGLKSHYGVAGTLDLLKQLLAEGFPVMVESWFVTEKGGMGHYRLLTGYNDDTNTFNAYDSYHGINQSLPYVAFDKDWQAFQRTYILIYPANKTPQVKKILADRLSDEKQINFEVAQSELANQPNNVFAQFNMGSSLVMLEKYQEAAKAYDAAAKTGWPWRMLWYQFGVFKAYYQVGRYQDVLRLAKQNLNLVDDLEESWYWAGKAYEGLGNNEKAIEAYQKAVQYKPNYPEAQQALQSLL